MDKYVGKRLDGRYEIQEIIGVGGMAVVYKAFDNQENRIVAVKILKDEFTSNQEFIRRFKNESKAIAMLSHQNIVKVYDVSFGDLIQYIVMEYIEGITLKEFIERQGSLRWKDAVHFTIQILRGLQHAHDKGIVHRDVKPQNIMVLADGTIKVTDFGIARFTRSDQRTITDKAIGSVHYISPEQAKGEKTDEKSDIYSVGVMLYEMITGQMPFQADSAVSVAIMQLQREPKSPTEINGSIPEGLEQITMHAMQKTPERRYQSSAEMLCDLDAFRKDPAITFGYNYFVDDSPTRFVGGVVDNEPVAEIEEEEEKEKSSIIPILTGVAVTLVLALIVLGIIFIPKFLNGSTAEIACPDFVGKKYEEILDNDEYVANFKFDDEWDHNDEYDFGYIYEQSEKQGEMLKKGANITLYISMGENTKKVPDVYGKSESAAKTELEANGFTTTIVEMQSEDVEKGLVVKTEPQRTQVVEKNAKITIYVSTGMPEKKVAVPDVTGMSEDAAKKKLEEEKFTVKVESIQLGVNDKYYPVGIVAKQSPDNSVKDALEGSEVTIYVCQGYKTNIEVTLPEDLNETWGTYSISLWENGTMVHKGDTIEGMAMTSYTFKDFVTKSEKAELTVKVSVDGSKWFNYCGITVNNKNGKQTEQKYTEYKDLVSQYKNNQSSSQSSGVTE
ncbi:MAG: Stk1 family PASTA domain-containing Ser/Thr kinase [Clostridia bacterium]|nr:Stk1 family PASTA domain-containing Ser/Thr kinase [Clostridia bacterium]